MSNWPGIPTFSNQRFWLAAIACLVAMPCSTLTRTATAAESAVPHSASASRRTSLLESERAGTDGVPTWIATLRRRGQERIDHAYDLAARGAVFSAQQELFGVLRMVTQAIDTHRQTSQHNEALSAALLALKEADEFRPSNARGAMDVDLHTLLTSHQSGILSPAHAPQITPLMALQRYYSYAQRRLVEASHGEPLAAEALYGLGRLQTLLSDGVEATAFSEQKTLLFYVAAITVDPQHYIAANELGVLFTRLGQFEYAQKALEQSVAASLEAENSRNLLAVYKHNGENERAAQLMRLCRLQGSSGQPSGNRNIPDVAWVSAEVLAESGSPVGMEGPAVNRPAFRDDQQDTARAPLRSQVPRSDAQSKSSPPLRRWLKRVKSAVSQP